MDTSKVSASHTPRYGHVPVHKTRSAKARRRKKKTYEALSDSHGNLTVLVPSLLEGLRVVPGTTGSPSMFVPVQFDN